ncbi:MAG: hypothetical protein L6R42_009374 [Xanthoria sp. 1 TBL-2021]|nr:MAG: hypothetical protein L6R42_009374 [Xanthoria sp. 1 TBL-2021]
MAEEPQPPNIHEGVDPTEESPATAPPASAEDRKAAAALSSLDNQNDDSAAQTTKAKNIDQEALAKAISRLELSTGAKVEPSGQSENMKQFEERRRKRREEKERLAKVKVDAGDVALLVSYLALCEQRGSEDWKANGRVKIQELDLSKTKATDLLKAHEGDAVKAMRAFVTAPV